MCEPPRVTLAVPVEGPFGWPTARPGGGSSTTSRRTDAPFLSDVATGNPGLDGANLLSRTSSRRTRPDRRTDQGRTMSGTWPVSFSDHTAYC